MKKPAKPRKKRRPRNTARYQLSADAVIDYKNLELLQKFINDRGRILSRRVTGVNAKQQRSISSAIKRARFLGLLNVGAVR
jgi:small subunit ribosomal protein S18